MTWQAVQVFCTSAAIGCLIAALIAAYRTRRLIQKWRAEIAELQAETTVAERLAATMAMKLAEKHGVTVAAVDVTVSFRLHDAPEKRVMN